MYIVTFQAGYEYGFYLVDDEDSLRNEIERLNELFPGYVDVKVYEVVQNDDLNKKVDAMVEEIKNKKTTKVLDKRKSCSSIRLLRG